MVIKNLIAATVLSLMLAAAAPAALATTHVRIHVKREISNSSAANPVTTTSAVEKSPAGLKIGGVVDLDPTQYQITKCAPQVWNVTRKEATALWLEFDSINVPGDQVVVSTPNGSFPQVLNSAPDGITTLPIPGKALKIEFCPSNASNSSAVGCAATGKLPSFTLAKLGYGLQSIKKEQTCGKEEFKNPTCLPEWKIKASPIMRLMIIEEDGSLGGCTGWLWGSKGHIITNHHCISSQTLVDGTRFQFQVEIPKCDDKKSCEWEQCPVGETLVGKGKVDFIKADKALDYAVAQIKPLFAPYWVKKYAYLKIRDGIPAVGEPFYIVQHPNAGPKVVSYTTDSNSKRQSPKVLRVVPNARGVPTVVQYLDGTGHGSSGSPVISRVSGEVIGLHSALDPTTVCTNNATSSNQLATALRSISKATTAS